MCIHNWGKLNLASKTLDTISNPEPAILCGDMPRLWETPAKIGL
jgi:hypothetical protein